MKKLSGTIAKQLVIKQYGDNTVLASYPDMSRRILSEKQIQNNELMEKANRYAKNIMGFDETCNEAQLRLNVTRNRLYTTLIKEYFKTMKEEA